MKALHSLSCLLAVCVLLIIGLFFVPIASSQAAVPQLINYQGKLTKATGAPLDTTISMVFTIYADSNGTTSKWSESQSSVKVEKGVFNVLLGSTNAIPDSVFEGSIRYLGVKVGGDPEITPRKAMVSVPYAYRAGVDGEYWTFRVTNGADTTLMTGGQWGLARHGNFLYGSADSTHVNLGVDCITGTIGHNYKYCTVGGGLTNAAKQDYATVGGGYSNAASGGYANVGGGELNGASGFYANVGGGEYDTASGDYATVGGGHWNTASGYQATVGGGQNDTASGDIATVGGGMLNTAAGSGATVGGGESNAASQGYATVGGGAGNAASGTEATVGGGQDDTASGSIATVGGGLLNTASGNQATVGGGIHNTASGGQATVGGGYYNSNSGDYCVIPGGGYDTVTAAAGNSMAFGYMVYVNTYFKVAFFGGRGNSGRLGINRDDHDGGILYPIHVGTNTGNGNGAYLSAGGVWTNGSSRTFKEKFQPLDSQELLEKISSLPVESWNYKNSPERHIGPVAEDFVSAFDVGAVREDGTRDNKYLSTEDIAGVALAGVKELIKENQEQRQMIEQLKRSNALLEDRLTHLEKTR